jgi:hypothetical protein
VTLGKQREIDVIGGGRKADFVIERAGADENT